MKSNEFSWNWKLFLNHDHIYFYCTIISEIEYLKAEKDSFCVWPPPLSVVGHLCPCPVYAAKISEMMMIVLDYTAQRIRERRRIRNNMSHSLFRNGESCVSCAPIGHGSVTFYELWQTSQRAREVIGKLHFQ